MKKCNWRFIATVIGCSMFLIGGAIRNAQEASFLVKPCFVEAEASSEKPQLIFNGEIYDRYETGKTITLPSATASGQVAALTIKTPSGDFAQNGFVTNESSCMPYIATYTVSFNGEQVTYEYPFIVAKPQVSVLGQGSVNLTAYPYLDSIDAITYENAAALKELYKEGALFTAYKGDKIKINGETLLDDMKVVKNSKGNLSNFALCDEAGSNQRVLSLGWCPSDGYGKAQGKTDFSTMYIKAINVDNADEYVTFKLQTKTDKSYMTMIEENGKTVNGERRWVHSIASSQSSSGDLHFSLFYNSETCTWYAARIDSAYGWAAVPVGVAQNHIKRVNFEIWFEDYTDENIPAQIFVNALRNERCGKVYYDDMHELVEHAANAPTCVETGNRMYWSCSICKKVFSDGQATTESTIAAHTIEKMGHVWRAATCTTPKTCIVCKKQEGAPTHKYDNACDDDCNYCFSKRAVSAHTDVDMDGYCDECEVQVPKEPTKTPNEAEADSKRSKCLVEWIVAISLGVLLVVGSIVLICKRKKR